MTNLNPSTPDTVGLEWKPTRQLPTPLSRSQLVGVLMDSTATESIIRTVPRIINASAQPVQVGVDVYDYALPMNDAPHWAMVLASANFSNAAGWSMKSGAAEADYGPTAVFFINDKVAASDPINTGASTQLLYSGVNPALPAQILFSASGTVYDGDTGASGAALSGQRISAVEVVAIVESVSAVGAIRIEGALNLDGGRYASDSGPIVLPQGTGLTRLHFRWSTDPRTGKQWNTAAVTELTDGSSSGFGIAVLAKANPGYLTVTTCYLQFRAQTERRLATGYANAAPDGGASQWLSMIFEDIDTGVLGALWSKVSGHQYAVGYYLTGKGGVASLCTVDSGNVAGHQTDRLAGWAGMIVPASNLIRSAQEVFGTWAPATFLRTPGATTSPDAQPYFAALPVAVGSGTNQQHGMSLGAGPFGAVIATVRATSPTANLIITVGGETATVTPAEVRSDGLFHLVSRPLSGSAASPTAVTFTSAAAGWECVRVAAGALAETGDATLAAAVSSTGSATWAGTAYANSDIVTAAQTIPATPSGLTVSQGSHTLSPAPVGGPTTVKHAAVDWTSTVLGSGHFDYYELQRKTPDGTDWDPIALITAEAQSFFNDQGARRGVQESYRLRVVRQDGAASAFAGPVTITVAASDDCGWIFASNAVPNLVVAYQENGDAMPRNFTRRNAQAAVVHDIEGLAAPVAFLPTEGASDVFQIPLIVALDAPGPPATIGRAAFAPLLALIESSAAPHVDVLDGYGNRWAAFVKFVQGSQTWTQHEHGATVEVTEVEAFPIITAAPATVS